MTTRATYNRDELVQALRVVTRFLQGFPASMSFSSPDGLDGPLLPHTPAVPRDGAAAHDRTAGDGAVIGHVTLKGQPQAPRKLYAPAPKVRVDRIQWSELPRAARRIGELVLATPQPWTSHAIMAELKIARPTFNNAMSVLLRRKIVVATSTRDSVSLEHR